MRDDDKKIIIDRYNKRLNQYGYDPRTLGWARGKQEIRFTILSEIGDINDCSILDLGCGFGDFYDFLNKNYNNFHYTGLDINPALISIARDRHPEISFEIKDILNDPLDQSYDYVVASGIFNFKIYNHMAYVKKMLDRMMEIADKGIAIDFLSAYVDYQNEDAYHFDPIQVFKFCRTLSRRITLRYDYMPFEFAMYIYKNDDVDDKLLFKEFEY
jgi:SAM-dependent methyltransferase